MLEVVKVSLLSFIAVGLVGGGFGAVWYMRHLTRQIIGEVRAAGLVRAALDDEFGPPPAAVQGGRHRELHLVGSPRPGRLARALMHRMFAAS